MGAYIHGMAVVVCWLMYGNNAKNAMIVVRIFHHDLPSIVRVNSFKFIVPNHHSP